MYCTVETCTTNQGATEHDSSLFSICFAFIHTLIAVAECAHTSYGYTTFSIAAARWSMPTLPDTM